MTSQAGAPDAAAVYLNRDEETDGARRITSVYARIKVLKQAGTSRANVEVIPDWIKGNHLYAVEYSVTDLAARTIQPNGTVVPFQGKPSQLLVTKGSGYRVRSTVFTLPDAQVGSILEYRYKIVQSDQTWVGQGDYIVYSIAPVWQVQNDLYLREGHFSWSPGYGGGIGWAPMLPAGFSVKQAQFGVHGSGGNDAAARFELNVHDIPPAYQEADALPAEETSYQVRFYYGGAYTLDERWRHLGERWKEEMEHRIGHGAATGKAVQGLVAAGDSEDGRLRKIYAAVMALENTDYTREHTSDEDKRSGGREVKGTEDVWANRRGDSNQLAELFVAMARAAGMKASMMAVGDRSREFFFDQYPSLNQLEDTIAVVEVDGKERFFDPGSRYCAYGHLAWQHTSMKGMRETAAGTTLVETPAESYKDSVAVRTAELMLDDAGVAQGKVRLAYMGAEALRWRQAYLREDRAALEQKLVDAVKLHLPPGMEVKLASVANLEDYEQPLQVVFEVKGAAGQRTGKRLLLAEDLFEANSAARFADAARTSPVMLEYCFATRDVLLLHLPANTTVEAMPAGVSLPLEKYATYSVKANSAAGTVSVERQLLMGEIFFAPRDCAALRSFYGTVQAKDREAISLKIGGAGGG